MRPSGAAGVRAGARVVALAGVFAVGVAAGVYGWQARQEAADDAAAAAEVELVGGQVAVETADVGWNLSGARSEFTAAVFNLGHQDVTVLAAWPSGWRRSDVTPHAVLPAGRWTGVSLSATPACEEQPRPELHLLVRTGEGDHEVTLELPPRGNNALWLHREQCELWNQAGIGLETMEAVVAGDGTLEMHLLLRHTGPAESAPITVRRISREVAGFTATGTNLPLVLQPGDAATASVRWTVEACRLTQDLGDLAVTARLESAEFVSRHEVIRLPGSAVASLARFGVAECRP